MSKTTSGSFCGSCVAGIAKFCSDDQSSPGQKNISRALSRENSAKTLAPEEVLQYWFGSEPWEVRSALWIQGLDWDDRKRRAGEVIAERFGFWIRSWGKDPAGGPAAWQSTPLGLVALVLLFDAFPRLAFEGTQEMFEYNPLAQKYATAALAGSDQLPWPFALFCHVAAVHGEDLAVAVAGEGGITQLCKKLHEGPYAVGTGKTVHKYFYAATAKPAVALLKQFGRDPRRNVLLNRPSTATEKNWLNTKKELPKWARRPEAPSPLTRALSGAGLIAKAPQGPRLRILVLHGSDGAKKFDKATRSAFRPLREVADLVLAEAPHPAPAGLAGRVYWDAVKESGGSFCYVGLDDSLQHLLDLTQREGPFDGVLGFSQGACLAGILAALPAEQRAGLDLRFVIMISGFYCRDRDRMHLHLEKSPEEHTRACVEPRRGAIEIPSFHIRGTSDAKVEAWRSHVLRDCFLAPQEATHPGGHMAVEQWPIEEVVEWLQQFPASIPQRNGDHPSTLQSVDAGSPFATKCEALRRLPRLGVGTGAAIGLPDSPAFLFKCPDLRNSPEWLRFCELGPVVESNGVTASDVRNLVVDARKAHGEDAVEDLFLLAWHLYPFPGLKGTISKEPTDLKAQVGPRQWQAGEGIVFFWMFHAVSEVAPPEMRMQQIWHLGRLGGWADVSQLCRVMATEDPSPGATPEKTEAFHSQVAEVFACQLHEDNLLAAKVIAEVSADEGKSDSTQRQISRILDANTGKYALPSDCFRSAPRFSAMLQRVTGLALRTACRLHEMRFAVQVTDRERFRARLQNEYKGVLHRIQECLDLHSQKRLHELKIRERELWSKAFMSKEEWERLRATPLSDAIVNPIPEPVEVAPEEELAPLYSFLNSGASLQPNTLGDMTFDRGTLTTDRRLDLCKQVIGPTGITGLFDALAHDRQSQRHVQHLLLGNNVCGPELPARVAEYIRRGNSQLTTWYIAGNRLTGESLQPLCDVLEDDREVQQLWLKRNPLRADGARRIAKMLDVNSYLQVLDVSFCGLLDQGAELLVGALHGNQALRHLYLDANGLSKASAELLAGLVGEPAARLETLSMGLNRLYDEGAEALAGGLAKNTSVQKFCVASCGIGEPGITSLAESLKSNRHLQEFDAGFLKATTATGELPNRAEDGGCCALAAALRENTSLRVLKISHNGVGLEGRRALRDALCGPAPNTALLVLEYEQRGMPRDPQLLRDELTAALLRNLGAMSDGERARVQAQLRPHHLAEIASVYRLGNIYSPGPPADDTALQSP